MDIQNIKQIENPKFYLDKAFSRASEISESTHQKRSFKELSIIKKAKLVELERISSVRNILASQLKEIITSYPSIDGMPEFYRELIKISIDYDKLKLALGSVNWSIKQINSFFNNYKGKILRSKDPKTIAKFRASFYGRISSVLNQIKLQLEILEDSRRIMKDFPLIRTDIMTFVIAGFPNVGKTSLLSKLTDSKPKIAPYPFTTQNLMIGYAGYNDNKLQIIDTPGLLDRPLNKRNNIEKHAIIALKYVAHKILFIIDASESCGYTLNDQVNLLEEIEKSFNIEIIVILNKIDLISDDELKKLKEKFKNALLCSTLKNANIEIIKDKIYGEH